MLSLASGRWSQGISDDEIREKWRAEGWGTGITYVEAVDKPSRLSTRPTDVVHVLLNGQGLVHVGSEAHQVLAGDEFVIAASTPYSLEAVNHDSVWMFAYSSSRRCTPSETVSCTPVALPHTKSPTKSVQDAISTALPMAARSGVAIYAADDAIHVTEEAEGTPHIHHKLPPAGGAPARGDSVYFAHKKFADDKMPDIFGACVKACMDGNMEKLIVQSITAGSPAHLAGIGLHDQLISWNGVPLSSYGQWQHELAKCKVGQVVPVGVVTSPGLKHTTYGLKHVRSVVLSNQIAPI